MKVFIPATDLSVLDEATELTAIMKADVGYIVPQNFGVFVQPSMVKLFEDFIPKNMYAGEDLNEKSLICFRHGGIGDLLFITTALRRIKEKYPRARLTLACNPLFAQILYDLEFYAIVYLPLKKIDIDTYDYCLFFEGIIEGNPRAEIVNAYDLIAERFGLEPSNELPVVTFPNADKVKAKGFMQSNRAIAPDLIHVGVQIAASVPKRSVPLRLYQNVIMSLPNNYRFWFFGGQSQIRIIDAFIFDLDEYRNCAFNVSKDLPALSQTAAMVGEMHFVIGPDSSILHIAGALRKPMIGIYGPFASELRLKYYKNAIGIDPITECEYAEGRPSNRCWEHGIGVCNLARKTMGFFSPCMELIEPNVVLQSIERLGFPVK